ncbi:MAG: hypothetical protein Q9212_002841 [Teloschistes hypoglaucus]
MKERDSRSNERNQGVQKTDGVAIFRPGPRGPVVFNKHSPIPRTMLCQSNARAEGITTASEILTVPERRPTLTLTHTQLLHSHGTSPEIIPSGRGLHGLGKVKAGKHTVNDLQSPNRHWLTCSALPNASKVQRIRARRHDIADYTTSMRVMEGWRWVAIYARYVGSHLETQVAVCACDQSANAMPQISPPARPGSLKSSSRFKLQVLERPSRT